MVPTVRIKYNQYVKYMTFLASLGHITPTLAFTITSLSVPLTLLLPSFPLMRTLVTTFVPPDDPRDSPCLKILN